TTGAAYDQLVLHDKRRTVDVAAAFLYVLDFHVPDFFTRLRIECDDVIVHRAEENESIADGDTPIKFSVGRHEIAWNLVVVGPKSLSVFGVECEHTVLTGD